MKQLKLKALELGGKEVLTRAQLKNILGGSGNGGNSCSATGCGQTCYCDSDSGTNVCWASYDPEEVYCDCAGVIFYVRC